jgi:hypothetical protein
MLKALLFIFAAAAILAAESIYAHEMTEKYIPVGAYQSLRSAKTHLGTITSVNETDRTLTLRTDTGEQTYKVTENTKIWLDRSQLKETNLDGTLADCKPGMTAEVHAGEAGTQQAYWIKVQIAP